MSTPFSESDTSSTLRSLTPARPTAASMRPQFGSDANRAVLTNGECATVRATWSASASLPALETVISTNFVAPSPSRIISCASSVASSVSAAWKASAASLSVGEITKSDCPVAVSVTASLVLVSPSTVIRLKLTLTAVRSMPSSISREITASVAMKPSIVAIFG